MSSKLFVMIYLVIMTVPLILVYWYIAIKDIKDYPFYIARNSLVLSIFLTIVLGGLDILFFLYFFG